MHLSARGKWQPFYEVHLPRNLIRGQLFVTVCNHRLTSRFAPRLSTTHTTGTSPTLCRLLRRRGHGDAWHLENDVLDLARVDVRAARNDHVGDPAHGHEMT